MATATKSANGKQERKQLPFFRKAYFPVQIVAFEHPTKGDWPNFGVRLTKVFRRDEESEWETTEYLGAQDLLPAQRLLGEAYEAIQERLQTVYEERQPDGSQHNGNEVPY